MAKAIFSRNQDIDKIAFLNWRISKNDDIKNLLVLADGYLMSAIELAKNCVSDNSQKQADILIFPILANANHGIELYLKAMIWTINLISGSQESVGGNHNIQQLFSTLKSRIIEYKGNITTATFNADTIDLREYISELFEKIQATSKNDKMDFPRYPFGKDRENHFYVDELGNVEIDLENFVNRFEAIKSNLETMSSYLFYQELQGDW